MIRTLRPAVAIALFLCGGAARSQDGPTTPSGAGSWQKVTNDRGTTFLERLLPDGRGLRLQVDYTFKRCIG